MKSVKIHRLTMRNFKGVRDLTLELGGQDSEIYGTNAAGKTTVVDAFLWLLFDKDSQNKKDFGIKTIVDGEALNNADHEVECELAVNNEMVILRKVYREKWETKRGSAQSEYKGNKTLYYVDEVPKKKGEYSSFIESLVEEDVFKLLTSPTFFNEKIKWEDRRRVLLEVAGDVSDEEVFESNEDLKGLKTIMQGKKLADFRAIIESKKKVINEELKTIPIRISEIQKSIPEESGDIPALQAEVAELEKGMESAREQISAIKNGGAILAKKNEVQQLEMKLSELKRTIESDSQQEVYKLRAKLQEEKANLQNLEAQLREKEREIVYKRERALTIEEDLKAHRAKYREKDAEEFQAHSDCNCPTCGQELPEEEVQSANEKALAAFNLQKSEALAKMKSAGVEKAGIKKKLISEIEEIIESCKTVQEHIDKKNGAIEKMQKDLEIAESNVQTAVENDEYISLFEKKKELIDSIKGLEEGAEEAVAGIEDEIRDSKARRDQMNAEIAKYANVKELHNRINKLEEQEKELAKEYGILDRQLYLSDEFIRSKVRILEENINSKFEYAQFKLFDVQVNGGVKEVCETIYKGVEYNKGLNNAAKINVGLDILKVLSKFYGIEAPIFIDNAESVVEINHTDAQMIQLIVSKEDGKLRLERKEAV